MKESRLRLLATDELTTDEVDALRRTLWAAFADEGEDEQFTEHDWQHALGGTHFVLDVGGAIVSHAAVIERVLHVAGRALSTGYVEAVATAPQHQGRGHGSTVMRAVGQHVDAQFELGALGTGRHGFYERLGWQTWSGSSSVRLPSGDQLTPDDDGYIMFRLTPQSPPLLPTAPISCEWRPGDVW